MMNVRGNVPITKVSDTKDREQVVVALAGNDAMPHEMPVFNCPEVLRTDDLPHVYTEASSHIVSCNNFAASIATRCAFSVGSMVNKVVAEATHLINEGELVQHGDLHVITQIADTCKKLKHQSLLNIAASCCCSYCSSLTARWRRQDDNALLYNSGDACHLTEVKLYCRSREFEGMSKTTLFQLSRVSAEYSESSVFSMGVPGMSHQQIHNDLYKMCSPLCASGTLPFVPHHVVAAGQLKGLELFHFVDGDSGYLVVSRIPSMNRYVCNGFEVSFKDSERKETWIRIFIPSILD